MGGFAAPPMASARFGNVTLSAAFGGLIPSLFNLHFHGFPDAAMYGAAASGSFPHGFSNPFHGGHSHMHSYHRHTGRQGQQDNHLKILFFVFMIVVVSYLLSSWGNWLASFGFAFYFRSDCVKNQGVYVVIWLVICFLANCSYIKTCWILLLMFLKDWPCESQLLCCLVYSHSVETDHCLSSRGWLLRIFLQTCFGNLL